MNKKKIGLIAIVLVVCLAVATGVSVAIWSDTNNLSGNGENTTGDWNASAKFIEYEKIMDGEIQKGWRVVGYIGTVTNLVVPEIRNDLPVLEISSKLSNNSLVTEVTLPKSITFIGDNAFVSFTRLAKVKIVGATFTIGANSFSGCRALTTFTYTDSTLQAMGENAFLGCNALTVKPTVTVVEVPNE